MSDESVSDEIRRFLEALPPHEARPRPPAADDLAGWARLQALIEERMRPVCEAALARYGATLTGISYGPLDGLLVVPASIPAGRAPVIYLHGGAYTGYSARSSLAASVPLAADLGRPLIAIDYPLAPGSRFTNTVPLVTEAVQHGIRAFPGAALIGESAGGGLALAVSSRLARQGNPPPALCVISPWCDLGARGDSRVTLAAHDPVLSYASGLSPSAQAYAQDDIDHPDASPVFADYSGAFPPTLVLCGSREILMSDSLRLYARMRRQGGTAWLSVYEGMIHSFPVLVPDAPESSAARSEIRDYLNGLLPLSEPRPCRR